MVFNSSGTKAIWSYTLETTHKKVWTATFQQDWPKEKITALLIFLPENLEKFCSTKLYGAALEGSKIFLGRSSFGSTSMERCQLADLKYAIFRSTGRKTKKLPRSKLFLSMVFKHGLLEGSTSEQMWSTVFPRGWDARRLGRIMPA